MKIATKCDPTSRSRDKFDITEILVSLKIGMLSHENVPRNDLLIFFIKLSRYKFETPCEFILFLNIR